MDGSLRKLCDKQNITQEYNSSRLFHYNIKISVKERADSIVDLKQPKSYAWV